MSMLNAESKYGETIHIQVCNRVLFLIQWEKLAFVWETNRYHKSIEEARQRPHKRNNLLDVCKGGHIRNRV